MTKIPPWIIYLLIGLQVVFGALVGTEGLKLPPWAMAIGNAVGALATWAALQIPGAAPPDKPKDPPDA